MDDVFGTAAIFLISILLGVVYWSIHALHKDLTKSMIKLEADLNELKSRYQSAPIDIGKLPPTIASLNFVKEKEERKKPKSKAHSEEHKAKLSAARKAFWEKKKAAEQQKPAQPPVIELPHVS